MVLTTTRIAMTRYVVLAARNIGTVDIGLLDLAWVQVGGVCLRVALRLDHCRCCCRLIGSGSVERSLCQALEGGCWIAGSVSCNGRIVYNERVDIVVRDDVGHYLLVLFRSSHWPSSLYLSNPRLAGITGPTTAMVCQLVDGGAGSFLRDCALENDLGAALARVMLQALAQHLSLAVLLRLIVEVEHFAVARGRLGRFSLLLRVWLSYALCLQGLPV